MGDYEKALPLYNRALDIVEKKLGQKHPNVARSLNNLAGLYDNMGDYEQALPLYNRALDIVEKKLGQKHSYTVIIRNNYNWILSKMSEENEEK